MLSDTTPIPTIPTKNLDAARHFYEDALGMKPGHEEPMGGLTYDAGKSHFLLYPSEYAGTNKATAMSFEVDGKEFDETVPRLRKAGVTFQTFDLPSDVGKWEDGVAVAGPMKSVWFTDPDGNVLNVSTGMGSN